jgi:hypothetical protein
MHQPPKDGDHHPSNPDGVPKARMGGRPSHPPLPRSLGTGTPGVIALAGFLISGMVASTAAGRPRRPRRRPGPSPASTTSSGSLRA